MLEAERGQAVPRGERHTQAVQTPQGRWQGVRASPQPPPWSAEGNLRRGPQVRPGHSLAPAQEVPRVPGGARHLAAAEDARAQGAGRGVPEVPRGGFGLGARPLVLRRDRRRGPGRPWRRRAGPGQPLLRAAGTGHHLRGREEGRHGAGGHGERRGGGLPLPRAQLNARGHGNQPQPGVPLLRVRRRRSGGVQSAGVREGVSREPARAPQ
mmetsp:Transcript_35093/g.91751  ORF Transcript_35093/g.91751 Transcript_35093/m.91751 type:complete len:210 (+) Transcript_35093:526-1155(+)